MQTPIIKKIRKIIKNQENGLNSSKSSDDDTSIKTDDEKPVSEEEILESLGLKHVARTPDGKIDHAKLSMKDRMAIVRGDIYLCTQSFLFYSKFQQIIEQCFSHFSLWLQCIQTRTEVRVEIQTNSWFLKKNLDKLGQKCKY